jgi:hypothetical protein
VQGDAAARVWLPHARSQRAASWRRIGMTGVSLGGGCTSDGDRGCRCASDGDREADARPASTGRRMRVRRRRGGGCASSVARGGGCASGITRGGDGASGVVRGGGCASSFDREVDACPAVVGKGREVGSKPAGRRSASGRASSRRLLRDGGRRPLRLGRR